MAAPSAACHARNMATQTPPVAPPDRGAFPAQALNRADALDQGAAKRLASEVFEGHKKALRSRRQADLLREKLLLHIDGSGDSQWADILGGVRVAIPREISPWRRSEN